MCKLVDNFYVSYGLAEPRSNSLYPSSVSVRHLWGSQLNCSREERTKYSNLIDASQVLLK